jgi:hypothetical protein
LMFTTVTPVAGTKSNEGRQKFSRKPKVRRPCRA